MLATIPAARNDFGNSASGTEVTLLEKQSIGKTLLSYYGALIIVLTPFTLGFIFLVMLIGRSSFPNRVWLQGRRLFATKKAPAEGIDLREATFHLQRYTLLFMTLTVCFSVKYRNAKGKEKSLVMNRIFYGTEKFNDAVDAILNASK